MPWENSYTLICKDSKVAHEILVKFRKLGFMIAKKFPARPSPSLPIRYETLDSLIILEGKALSGHKVGKLDKGEIV